jgi:hypothetical protein
MRRSSVNLAGSLNVCTPEQAYPGRRTHGRQPAATFPAPNGVVGYGRETGSGGNGEEDIILLHASNQATTVASCVSFLIT